MLKQAKTILKETFGYIEFRELQENAIERVLAREDTLVIMPTGGGKSLCYQIPALIFEGLTIVVSPLISLMKDQVEQLLELGVEAVLLNSSLSPEEYSTNIAKIRSKAASLLYVAPETLSKPDILTLLDNCEVACITIDEAHCISEWGHDFRPDYRQLARIRARFPDAVCLALTATATPRVQDDICSSLSFGADDRLVASFNRENLFLQVLPKASPLKQLLEFLTRFRDQSGIIYCFSRRQVEELAAGLQRHGYSAQPYHAGLTNEERQHNQELFIRDDVQIIVATIAFGMGINKSNVRFVVHFDLPKSIESYYQEIGRAGRDGIRADCLLLFGYGDTQKIRYFIDQKEDPTQRKIAFLHLDKLVDFAETDNCRRKPLITYFGEPYDTDNCGMCDYCVGGGKELVDVTEAAQKFLSCVYRTGQLFGSAHIIDVLRGSESQKVFHNGHQNVSTYGIGKEFSKKQWSHLARQFLRQGLVVKDIEYGSLKLGAEANPVLTNQKQVFATIEEERIKTRNKTPVDIQFDKDLFDQLRRKRKELADKANLPPYVIFSDKSLMEMAAYIPLSEEGFLDIHGVGRAKLEKYGEIFLAVIRIHISKHQDSERNSLKES